jgi:hypothetical protein
MNNVNLKTRWIATASALAAAVSVAISAGPAAAASWGSLKGKFVLDGAAPKVPAVDASKDAYCVSQHPVDQTIVVGKDNAIANIVVYLKPGKGEKLEVHPDYEKSKGDPVVLDNHGCQFKPHVALIRTGQQFVIKNSDPVGHNTKAELTKNASFNQTIEAGKDLLMKFEKSEALPLPVNCGIHPFMHGWVFIKDDPYMAASGEDGTFEIKNIPAGKHEFQFWQEVPGYLKKLKLKGGATSNKGIAELTIEDGQTLDLGEIKVPASALQ